jgi:phosphatidylinositol alpha-1,6-mannosyltransferase
MRVAVVSPEFPPDIGGVETYALEVVAELARRGHEVTVFTVRHPRGEAEIPGVRVAPVLKLCTGIDRQTFNSHRADAWHALNAAYAWVTNDRPESVVSVYGNDFLRPYYPLAQPDLRRYPLAWRWADSVSHVFKPVWLRLTKTQVRRSLARAPHVVACSRYTERTLLEWIPECRGRTSVGFVGVARPFFDIIRQPRTDGVAHLLTVSRLSESRKNVDRVLHALARLKDRYAFRYTIVGDGHDRSRLYGLAHQLGLGDRVRFAGFVPREVLYGIYADSDLMVLASSIVPGSHEGFGIVYLEAAASGVPSLGARLAGAAEAIDEGRSGMYVEEPTVEALSDALSKFLAGAIRFDADACRSFARRFTWAAVVDHCLQYYPQRAHRSGERKSA